MDSKDPRQEYDIVIETMVYPTVYLRYKGQNIAKADFVFHWPRWLLDWRIRRWVRASISSHQRWQHADMEVTITDYYRDR